MGIRSADGAGTEPVEFQPLIDGDAFGPYPRNHVSSAHEPTRRPMDYFLAVMLPFGQPHKVMADYVSSSRSSPTNIALTRSV
jgi:hypothetical protein